MVLYLGQYVLRVKGRENGKSVYPARIQVVHLKNILGSNKICSFNLIRRFHFAVSNHQFILSEYPFQSHTNYPNINFIINS